MILNNGAGKIKTCIRKENERTMEWYGEKMLPRGLPELVYQITPPEISEDLKIISFNNSKGKGVKGRVGCDNNYYIMELFPTVIISDNSNAYSGTQSFCYWLGFLRTTLHEIGHIMTNELVSETYHQRYRSDTKIYFYIEKLADDWRDQAIERIASRDPRLGQPEGWIGGLPGIYILRRGKIRDNAFGRFESRRIKDIRAKKCGGQHGIDDITKLVWADSPCKRKMHRIIKRVAADIGVYRGYIDSAGRKHLFFNHNEARAVATEVRRLPLLKRWQKEEENKRIFKRWIKKEKDKHNKIEAAVIRKKLESQGQMRLPF